MERVAIYIRLSKEDIKKIVKGDDSESIKNQKLMLSEYAAKKGWQISDFYVDEDYSGADRDRPSFDRLLKDAKSREFKIVLCKTQNRFIRDIEAVEEIIHGKFLAWGIRFISLLDGADTANPSNKKSRQIHGLIDEWYLEDLSNNIRQVFKSKMEDGQYLSGFAPYGYIKDSENRHKLIIDEEAAKVVKKIYNLYLKGYGTHTISKTLTAEGIEKPSSYMKKKYDNFKLPNVSEYNLWGHTTINRILRNPIYIGTLVQGKETTLSYKDKTRIQVDKEDWIRVEDTHQGIIDEKDFYEVQRILDSKRRNKKSKGKTHIFATKVRCLHCGGSMIRSTTRSRKYDDLTYTYLKCKNNTLNGKLICKHKNRINYTDLYNYIELEFVSVMEIYHNNPEAKETTSRSINFVDYEDKVKKLRSELGCVEGELREGGEVLTDLFRERSKGEISKEEFKTISATLKINKEQLELRKRSINNSIDEIKRINSEKTDVEKVVTDYLKNHKLTYEIVNETVNYIEIGEKNDGVNRIINIYWKL